MDLDGLDCVNPALFGYAPLKWVYVGFVSGARGSAGIGWAGLGCFYALDWARLNCTRLHLNWLGYTELDLAGLGAARLGSLLELGLV